jgi:signal transduction histidine kinase
MRAEFQEVVRSIRSTSRRLMAPVTEDNSFTSNLALLCQNLERPGVGNIHFSSTGTEQRLSPIAHRYLARMVQELVHNAYRHSSAWHIVITLTWKPDALILTVEDDGSALNRVNEFIGALRKKNNTLRLRAQALKAVLRYVPGPKGLIAEIKYPL